VPTCPCGRRALVTAHYFTVDVLLASVTAVVGTLLGSTSTYVFQQLTASRAEDFARAERLRQERVTAYSVFAGTITDLLRGVIAIWFRQHSAVADAEDIFALRAEANRVGRSPSTPCSGYNWWRETTNL
jgi:hypothetical protein